MRKDALGLWWEDKPPEPKEKKTPEKRKPPERTWERPGYLPGLEEAKRMPGLVELTSEDLVIAAVNREQMLFDIECYKNYYLASFRSAITGKYKCFEMYPGKALDIAGLKWMLEAFTSVGFNSINYDLPITYMALDGRSTEEMHAATQLIIVEGWQTQEVLKLYKCKRRRGFDHIDLIEVAPLRANLKIYGGRLHTPRMQDLPFDPLTELSEDQRAIVKWYNLNSDLTSTGFLHNCLHEHLDLRVKMSNEYQIDLRSKSDAQIAEHVIAHEYQKRTGKRPTRPVIDVGTTYRFKTPAYMKFQSSLLQHALRTVQNAKFVVGENGAIVEPAEFADLKLDINGSVYTMGIGGLHSTESKVSHYTDNEYIIEDKDVTSFYPFIMLNLGLYPMHLGPVFLEIFKDIVYRRIGAKRKGLTVIASSLKIVINGAYGKLASKFSILYSPDLQMQVTLTGQLSLLLLIERLELAGIHVVSANTDGIVIKCKRTMIDMMNAIVKQWEIDTNFNMEGTRYMSIHSKDVNNYIAIKQDFDKEKKAWIERPHGSKGKGAYANPWADPKTSGERLHKNPTNSICVSAVQAYLLEHVPVATTIHKCNDITKFVSVRTVKGGAVKVWDEAQPESNQYLGKSIRWYYAKNMPGELVYALTGNRVPKSEGAKPVMDLPREFPADVDYDWYVAESERILADIGCAA